MKPFLAALMLLLALCVIPISATVTCFDPVLGSWTCRYSCCFSFVGCCRSLSSVYWYAWLIVIVVVFLCVCACLGGGYGYRRYYYVHRVPTTTVVTATGQDYRYSSSSKYQPYGVPATNPPPPYTPTPEYTKDDLTELPPEIAEPPPAIVAAETPEY